MKLQSRHYIFHRRQSYYKERRVKQSKVGQESQSSRVSRWNPQWNDQSRSPEKVIPEPRLDGGRRVKQLFQGETSSKGPWQSSRHGLRNSEETNGVRNLTKENHKGTVGSERSHSGSYRRKISADEWFDQTIWKTSFWLHLKKLFSCFISNRPRRAILEEEKFVPVCECDDG